jgi:hypothetical protein
MDESKLTKAEYKMLETILAHAKDQKDLGDTLNRFTTQSQLLVASAVSKLGEALDQVMPGWREE